MKQSFFYRNIIVLFIFAILFVNCNNKNEFDKINNDESELVQVSVIDALVQGLFDGVIPISELNELGDIGIGTFDKLNGELIMYNDTIYQVLSSGEVIIPSEDVTTPFASVCDWNTDTTYLLNNVTFNSMKSNFDDYFFTSNIFYALKIEGDFKYMKTRSPLSQEKPYKTLAEATKNQSEFEFNNSKGIVIGFYCPDYVKGINVVGFHLHFLSSERNAGGHIMAFETDMATMELCYLYNFQMILPEGGDFFDGDFSVDRQNDLKKVEGDN